MPHPKKGNAITAVAAPVESSLLTRLRSAASQGAPLFVWGVWALMLAAALFFVWRYGGKVPFWDDWNLVPILTGNQSLSARWLWEQHNEHRIPVPKLVLLALYKLTGYDFRAGMFFNVLALGGLAFFMILTARRLRGWTSYTDAFFPLVFLNWGQFETLLISFTVNLVLPTISAGVILLIVIQRPTKLAPGVALLAGSCLLLLPLCGANGVALVPALALWVGYLGIIHWQSPEPRDKRTSFLLLAMAPSALVLVLLYFIGFHRPHYSYDPALASLRDYLRTSVQFLSMSFGPAVWSFWPYSGLVMLAVLLLTLTALVWAWWKQPQERLRAAGLLLFMAAMISLALGLGWGRSTSGPFAAFQSRYGALAAPVLCCAYFVWVQYGPAITALSVRMALFTLACALLPFNTYAGLKYAKSHRQQMEAFERDLRAGVPTFMLLKRYAPFLFFSLHDSLGESMRMLHRTDIGPFRFLQPDPPFQEISMPLVPHSLSHMSWERGTGHGIGHDPSIVFALPKPRYVAGIRIIYSYPNTQRRPLYFRMFWRRSDQQEFNTDRYYLNPFLERALTERTVTIWVGDTIDQLRIHPDNESCAYKLSAIVLLTPVGDDWNAAGP